MGTRITICVSQIDYLITNIIYYYIYSIHRSGLIDAPLLMLNVQLRCIDQNSAQFL